MDFYYAPVSPPCRAVMLTAKSLNVNLNKKLIDIRNQEHKSPEFKRINPRQCVPTIVDGDFMLFESGAIQGYLVAKYGKDDSLYPKDLKQRAKVDRCLYFNNGTLLQRFSDYQIPILRDGQSPDMQKKEKIREAVGWVNEMLEGHDYAVGNTITIADHSLVSVISTFKEIGADLSAFQNIVAWLDRCEKNIPGYDTENLAGAKKLGEFIKSKMP